MMTPPDLSGAHLRTYKTIFQHPVSHNLNWREVHALLANLGQLVEEPNGNFMATRNGFNLVLAPPRTKDVAEVEELMVLRHFLERSDPTPTAPDSTVEHWLLVIDHQQARIFRSEFHGALPEKLLPHEPDEYFRHAHNSKDFSRGQEKPDPSSFFEPVVMALAGTSQILIFGTGTGTGSEMEQFVAWAKQHHPDFAKRIVGSVAVDSHHLTDEQLLAQAREFYARTRTHQS